MYDKYVPTIVEIAENNIIIIERLASKNPHMIYHKTTAVRIDIVISIAFLIELEFIWV